MNFIRLLPVCLSFLLIAAHFQRAGNSVLAIICLMGPLLLIITRTWSVRIVQIVLALAAIEWLRTLYGLVQLRMEFGLPWLRLAVILTVVVLLTVASVFVFRHPEIREKYKC